jgi:polar amino acid transport system substrate-binding protein
LIKKLILISLIFNIYTNAKELQIVFSHTTPPFVFEDGKGIVVDIIKESLKHKQYAIKPVFVNIGRSFELFKNGHVDATSIIKKSSGLEAYYSEYFMQYHNAAIMLKSNNYNIKKIEDLQNYYFSSFQNASVYLGKKFGKTAKIAGERYSEIADQKLQVYKLLRGRTDIAIMDKYIFKYYKNQLIHEKKVPASIETKVIELFKPTKYRTAFKDKKIRDYFNSGLKKIKASGKYNEIYKHYSEKFFEVKQ